LKQVMVISRIRTNRSDTARNLLLIMVSRAMGIPDCI